VSDSEVLRKIDLFSPKRDKMIEGWGKLNDLPNINVHKTIIVSVYEIVKLSHILSEGHN
jgi:hypothetical protein